MSIIPILLASAVLDLVCTNSTPYSKSAHQGTFEGVLPVGFSENFTTWTSGKLKGELMKEDGVSFVRLTSQNTDIAQIMRALPLKEPGSFKFTIKARTKSGNNSLAVGIRQTGMPYKMHWNASFGKRGEWKEESVIFDCPDINGEHISLFLYPGCDTIDIAMMRIERVSEEAVLALIKRPPKDTKEYLTHTRFPLGLPSRWSEGLGNVQPATSSDNGALKIAPFGRGSVDSEPFQVIDAKSPSVAVIRYRAPVGDDWRVSVVNPKRHETFVQKLPKCGETREVRFEFTPKPRDIGLALRFSGSGLMYLEEVHVFPKSSNPDPRPQVALSMSGGELCEHCRLAFSDEKAKLCFACLDYPKGAILKFKVTDFYGRVRNLHDLPAANEGEIEFDPFPDARLGQFLAEAWLEKDGKRISPLEEFVFTRIERPLYWGKDAPESHFGGHISNNARMLDLCKASGVNWARLHDTGTEFSGWWMMEREKGKFHFFDEEIRRYRDHKMMIFAQLGTTPAWASHFHDLGLKSMGYFEKYLRPKNYDEFVAYVKRFAEHYRGVIGHYFFWNEPWGAWWVGAKDAKFYDPKRAINDFGELSRRTYTALKEVDKNLFFCGYNSNEGSTGAKWTKVLTDDDIFDYCDAIDYHFYTSKPRLIYGKDGVTSSSTLDEIHRKHPGHGGKQVWMSEGQGTSEGSGGVKTWITGLYRQIPWGAETKEELIETADFTARYTISILAEGVDKVFLYSQAAWYSMVIKPSYLTLVGADGFPGVSNASHAHMAKMLEGRKIVSSRRYGKDGGAWRFEGRGAAVEVFDNLTREEMLALAKETGGLTDIFGNLVTPETVLPGTVVYSYRKISGIGTGEL